MMMMGEMGVLAPLIEGVPVKTHRGLGVAQVREQLGDPAGWLPPETEIRLKIAMKGGPPPQGYGKR